MARAGDCLPRRPRLRGGVRHRGTVVSTVRIPADPFPFMRHRTLAEVARTTELRTMPRKLCALELEELRRLDEKAARHNPPPAPDVPA